MAYISFQPSDYYNTKIYTGTGSSNALTGVGFQPDFTWIKNRDAADFHVLTDAVRGATKYWQSNDTAAEVTNAESLKSFDSDGFTVGTQAEVNTNTEDYVSWNWKAGTTTGIAGSPTITPTSYSFNATSGFSIIAYTGTSVAATLPHGLGVAPKMIIVKKVSSTDQSIVYHAGMHATPEDYFMTTSSTAAAVNNTYWNDTAPTSTLFSIGTGGDVNSDTMTYIAYCFADVKGYSKFGNYEGNGNTNGPFAYTGFRPAFVMCKDTEDAERWIIFDSVRTPGNIDGPAQLFPDVLVVESDSTTRDIMWFSNGFKPDASGGEVNFSNKNYIYAAFAEFPLVSSNDVPTVAR